MRQLQDKQKYSTINKIMRTWYMYIMPLLALSAAFVKFHNYGIYLFLRYLATFQCAFYAIKLFPSEDITKKISGFYVYRHGNHILPVFWYTHE